MSYNELKQQGLDDFPVQLYEIDDTHPKYEMASHWHSHMEIIRVISGTLYVSLNGAEHKLKAGDIAFVNSETVHSAIPEDCVYECVVFSPEAIITPSEKSGKFLFKATNHIIHIQEIFEYDESNFKRTVDLLFDSMKNSDTNSLFTVTGALHLLFGIIETQKLFSIVELGESDKKLSHLKDVLSFMRTHYDTPITLDEMAQKAGMSPKYFCKFFKQMTNKTPFEYLTTYRIERASRKLIKSGLAITDVAFSCGFNDLSYFIKTFKKYKGMTPREFKKHYN